MHWWFHEKCLMEILMIVKRSVVPSTRRLISIHFSAWLTGWMNRILVDSDVNADAFRKLQSSEILGSEKNVGKTVIYQQNTLH